MARRPAGRKTVGPTRRQGKLSMRAAKTGKRGKKAKRVTKRAAKRSKGSSGYTPPRVASQPTELRAPSGPFNRAGISPGGAMMRGLLGARRS